MNLFLQHPEGKKSAVRALSVQTGLNGPDQPHLGPPPTPEGWPGAPGPSVPAWLVLAWLSRPPASAHERPGWTLGLAMHIFAWRSPCHSSAPGLAAATGCFSPASALMSQEEPRSLTCKSRVHGLWKHMRHLDAPNVDYVGAWEREKSTQPSWCLSSSSLNGDEYLSPWQITSISHTRS